MPFPTGDDLRVVSDRLATLFKRVAGPSVRHILIVYEEKEGGEVYINARGYPSKIARILERCAATARTKATESAIMRHHTGRYPHGG